MWPVVGTARPAGSLGPLTPEEVLYEFDGPRLFTARSPDGDLLLAYLCDADEARARFVVVPTDPSIVSQLQDGALPVRDALSRAPLWLVDLEPQGVVEVLETAPADLPDEALPQPGVLLFPEPRRPLLLQLPEARREAVRRCEALVQQRGLWAA